MGYAKECMPGTIIGMTMNGSKMSQETLRKDEIGSKSFNITIPEHSYVNEDVKENEKSIGTYRVIVAGHFLFLKPLDWGSHEIDINKSIIETEAGCDSAVKARINLIVV